MLTRRNRSGNLVELAALTLGRPVRWSGQVSREAKNVRTASFVIREVSGNFGSWDLVVMSG